jgi:hypothetical protein
MNNRIMFLRNTDYTPCGCLAISIDRKSKKLNYQYSVLNPDDRFDRKVARQLALGRLVESPIALPLMRDMDVNMHSISIAVMKHLSKSKAPSRAVKAAKGWLQLSQFMYGDC